MHREVFKSKLAAYSALASSLLALGKFSDAQIVYTDIIPDDSLFLPYVEMYDSCHYLDLNNDGQYDFKFTYSFVSITYIYASDKFWSFTGMQYGENQMLGDDVFNGVYAVPYGVAIKASKPWIVNGYENRLARRHWFFDSYDGAESGTYSGGSWLYKSDGYVGLKLIVNSDTLFGWVRMNASIKQYHSLIKTLPDTASTGTGYAYGVDLFFRDKKTIKHADYWISYSFLDSKRDYLYFPDEAVPSFAAKHTLTVVYKQFIPKINSSVSATYTFSTGRNYINPYSPVLPGKQLPDYNNLSLSFSYLTQIFQNFTVFVVGVGNVLGIDNIVGYRYINEGDPIEVKQPSVRSYFIGLFMTIGEDKGDDE